MVSLAQVPLSSTERIAAVRSQFRGAKGFDADSIPWLLLLLAAFCLVAAAVATYLLARRWWIVRQHRTALLRDGLEPGEVELYAAVAGRASTLELPRLSTQRAVFDRVALEWVAARRTAEERRTALTAVLSLRRRIPFLGRDRYAEFEPALADAWIVRWLSPEGVALEVRASVLHSGRRTLQLGLSEQATLPVVGARLSLLRHVEGEVFEAVVRVRGSAGEAHRQILVDRPEEWRPARLRLALRSVNEPVDAVLVERMRGGRTREDVEFDARVVACCREALVLEMEEPLALEEAVRLDEPEFSGRFTNLGLLERKARRSRYVLVPSPLARIQSLRPAFASAI